LEPTISLTEDPLVRWLDQLGLTQYSEAFIAEDVTLDLVPDLTPQDLIDLGVASVGHRRRILTSAKAIVDVTKDHGPAVKEQATNVSQPKNPQNGAEQRMITAMFCDLVGSTHLSSVMDPEEYRDVIAEFREIITLSLIPYSGQVARFLGDGIAVFFGLNRSQDHTAENAVAAALDIVERISKHSKEGYPQLEVRIGIATGLTVVNSSGPTSNQVQVEDTIVGEIPNLAARLQAIADPNTVLVSDATQNRLGHLFLSMDFGFHQVKGIEDGLQVWRIIGHAQTDSRFDARQSKVPTTEFVGRTDELNRLFSTGRAVSNGAGAVSVIVGDAGMGKSRLAREVLMKSTSLETETLIFQCTPYHTSTPFLPLRRTIERTFDSLIDADPGNGEPTRLKAQTFLQDLGLNTEENVDLLLDILLSDASPRTDERSALNERSAQISLLAYVFCMMAKAAGTIIIEDLQWIDPSTNEILTRVVERLHDEEIHILCTMRNGPLPHWCEYAHADVLNLGRLPAPDFANLVRSVARAANANLSDLQVTEIASRCDGSPVFAEELTRLTLERETEPGRTGSAPLPATLADSLLSRLDRLETGRNLAQLAAVIGNEFPLEILVAVSDLPKEDVIHGVRTLIDAGILDEGHSRFGAAIKFRHMLLKDAAYLTLLRRDRIAQHIRIANTVIRTFPALSNAMPHIVAHHMSLGGDSAQATTYWSRAGTLAASRSAYFEAIVHFRKALKSCANTSFGLDLEKTELTIRLNLTAALIAAHGFNTAEVKAEIPRIEALGATVDSADQMLPFLVSKWMFLGGSGQFKESLTVARQIEHLADDGDEIKSLLFQRCIGTANFFCGHLADSKQHLHAFFQTYDPAQHDIGLGRFGSSHHGTMSAVGLAEIAVLEGDNTEADFWTQKAKSLSEMSGLAHYLCHTGFFTGCVLPFLRGQIDVVATQAGLLEQIASSHGLNVWSGYADLFAGIAMMEQGNLDDGFSRAADGIKKAKASEGFLDFCMLFHAEVCLKSGLVTEARDSFENVGTSLLERESWLSANIRRVDALIAHQEGQPLEKVLSKLDRAHEIATSQGAHFFVHNVEKARASVTAS